MDRIPTTREGALGGGVFDSDLVDVEVRVPVLVFHGDGTLALPGQVMYPHSEFVYEPLASAGLRPDVIRVETAGSTHSGHTDASLTPASLREADEALDASLGTIEGTRMSQIMNDFTLRFFDHYLSGEGPGLDEAFRANYPEVTDVDLSSIRDWAATGPEPGFMSYTHVLMMNRALATDAASKAEAAKLDRVYTMAYELTDGPRGGTEWWLMTFDPGKRRVFLSQGPRTAGGPHVYGGSCRIHSLHEANASLTYSGSLRRYHALSRTRWLAIRLPRDLLQHPLDPSYPL